MNTVVRACLHQNMAGVGTGRAANGRIPSSTRSVPCQAPSALVSWRVGSPPLARPLRQYHAPGVSGLVGARNHRLPNLAACAKRKDDLDPLAEREAALQRREAELWERQGGMYERCLEELKEFKAMYGEERRGWMARELDLVKENNELRGKLMYLISRMGSVDLELMDADWVDGTAASGEISDVVSSREGDEEEIGVGKDTGRRVSGEAPAGGSIAADFAAAFAAVEKGDVLKDGLFPSKGEVASPSAQPEVANMARETASAPPSAPSVQSDVEQNGYQVDEQRKREPDGALAEIPTGPPPSLTVGDDNIYWMNQLHVALVDEGYFPGDEDIEDYFFGSQTQSALLTFQACSGLEETGCTDEATWRALLGDDLVHKTSRDLTDDMNPLTDKSEVPDRDSSPAPSFPTTSQAKPFAELFTAETYEVKRNGDESETMTHVHDEKLFEDGHVEVTDETVVSSSGTPKRKTWPTVLEGEGGQVVHALHVLLCEAGFYPCDDEMQWWQFGDSTMAAIRTFQACNGLAETGTANERLWKLLAGDGADPSIVDTLKSGNTDDEDLSLENREGMVWLIGEQRWCRPMDERT